MPSRRAQTPIERRIEGLIGLVAPALDMVLGLGERVSRIAEREDQGYYPIRSGGRVSLPGESGFDGSLPDEPLPAELEPRRADADRPGLGS